MAKRPRILPPWATAQYGGYGVDWDEAVVQCRRVLYDWAAKKKTGFYSELVPYVTAIPWPEGAYTHDGSQMGHLLGRVVIDELDSEEDRPLISALVIGKDEGMPSHGFWNLLDDLAVSVGTSADQRLKFWSKEVARCFETYGKARAST